MVDWAGGIQSRNYGIRRESDVRNLAGVLKIILSVAMIAGVLLFYSWVRSRIVDLGYEEQRLQSQEESLLREEKRLILVEQTLKSPERIDAIARNELGMAPLRASQLLTAQYPDVEWAGTTELAMAGSLPAAEAKKPPATN